MTVPYPEATLRRAEIQAYAARIGIDETYVSDLVDAFYARVRADAALGPIFEGVIGEDWDPHMRRMKDFWASVALNAGRYSGKPVPTHQRLGNVERRHFDIWLALFRMTLEDTAPSPEAIAYLMDRAERIAESLQLAMFGCPAVAEAKR